MINRLSIPALSSLRGALAAIALTSACSASWALPTFTYNPNAIPGVSGATSVTGDNFIIADYSTIKFGGVPVGTTFTEQGFLSVQSVQLGGTTLSVPGLNSAYGLYVSFNGSGTLASPTVGSFTSLNYTLFGYAGGPATFGVNPATKDTTVTLPGGVTPVALATGTLVGGDVGATPRGALFADATVTLTPTASGPGSGFFTSPTPFYSRAEASFIAPQSNTMPFMGGVVITQGGGNFSLNTPVPEPKTYAMMLAGLAAIGFLAKRRKH